ncbi:creatininase family protein [Shimazuella alba]|uniref:Creatininase family protein n=1 Tax=Shimazuella alba TaxID=2690964 RepID=A0A6I4VQ47_9BACL|nr:creatininase family protein [Shimazuella alba]MXQ52538.1 creatininase family protein [Shimazuella alba]
MLFQEQNSYEITSYIKKSKVAILPVGAVEAHGPHLPLGTDNYLAEELSKKLADEVGGLVLPTLPYGQVWSLSNFPGSLTLSNQTLTNLMVEIGESLFRQGFRIMTVINGHYGNAIALKEASRVLYEKFPDCKVFVMFYPGTKEIIRNVRESTPVHDSYFHACELETSYMLYLVEEKVQMEKAINDTPVIPETADVTPTPWSQFTKTAVLGDATVATREKGEKIISVALENMTRMIQQAKDELGC